jgi:CMP-N-acetylneuraminic acid synthetase|tara:strand:- start:92 stop:646 length:555 start_codon:yes stop_codon:yes gene_type:complete
MIIAIIPTKKNSNRMPDKNMRVLLGRPLLEHAIDYVKQSRRISRIYVSTDNVAIADFAESQGVKVVSRLEILGGETPLIDVYRHALNTMKLKDVKTVAGVQVDHPDRNISMDEALDKYEDEGLDCLYSKDAHGRKNGAHSIMSAVGILNEKFEKTGFTVDDCTNVHYESDLKLAEGRLISRDRY